MHILRSRRASNFLAILFLLSISVFVGCASREAKLEASATSGQAPFTVVLFNMSRGYDTFLWDFGDGVQTTTTTLEPVTHEYTKAGTHVVKLIAFDKKAGPEEAKTTTLSITVTPGILEEIIINPTQAELKYGESQVFSVEARDRYGNLVPSLDFAWQSNQNAGQVDSKGAFTAGKKPDTYPDGITVVATHEGVSKSASATIVIIPPSVLVDASRDGGAWWHPQYGPFDSNQPHQGRELAEYIRMLGYEVTELPRPHPITEALLQEYDIVIRANLYGTYSMEEIEAYKSYVKDGGKLLLLSDYVRPGEEDPLAEALGLVFTGTSRGENVLSQFIDHPLTKGLTQLRYGVGSGVTVYPSEAHIVGWLSGDTYLDLNDNQTKDPAEPSGAPALGYIIYGQGKIVFLGDTNLLQQAPQALVVNILNWFEE